MGATVTGRPAVRATSLFNTPLECGLRALLVLLEDFPAASDLDRLCFLDYFVVHSGDLANGPQSLHPPTPLRAGEVLVRRALVEQGLLLMLSRGLLTRTFGGEGIVYAASEDAAPFVACLGAAYTAAVRARARWVATALHGRTTGEISSLFRSGVERWGTELSLEGSDYEDVE